MPALETPAPIIDPVLLDVRGVAALLAISSKSVTRLAAAGKIPAPLRLGHLRRWSKAAIESWIIEQSTAAVDAGKGEQ